ncbi:MAG: 2-dehydro-3-deoxygalactonokinase [Isosphaeraceae bacterium]|nr:2-dehydro-3-deoxygalactonokinase [Isosphaeraceae bacterium]
MLSSRPFSAVALDGGTTNTRARLIRDGRIVATARRAVGVRDSILSDHGNPLASAVRASIEEVLGTAQNGRPDLIVAAGMLSSEIGLAFVPHVAAPAGIDELAAGMRLLDLPQVCDQPIAIVPGIRSPAGPGPDGWMAADVMRGEECETVGAWRALRQCRGEESAFLWPGSHTKLVGVDARGVIVGSHTTLAGELTVALARHTLLAASLPAELPNEPDAESLAAGARIVGREGLGRAAFLVRIAAITQSMSAHQRASFWIGAVVAEDANWLARHPIVADDRPLWVGGRQPQRSLYAKWLGELRRGPVVALDDDLAEHVSALGALAVALHRRARVT